MSYEFGNYFGGYFHHKIASAKEDLEIEATMELHKKLIPLFDSLYEISFAISAVEAGDSGEERSIQSLAKNLPLMRKQIENIESYIKNLHSNKV